MKKHNIPRKDSQAAQWMRDFATQLQAEPERYFVPAEEIDALVAAVADFRSSLAAAIAPSTRGPRSSLLKRTSRAAAEGLCRNIYRMVKNDLRVTDADKQSLGIHIDAPHRTRSVAPTTAPWLRIASRNDVYTVRWTGESSGRRGRPDGCAMLQLFIATADGEAGQALQAAGADAIAARATLLNVYTADRVTLCDNGLQRWLPGTVAVPAPTGQVKTVAFIARWASPKGQAGPWSRPATLRLAA